MTTNTPSTDVALRASGSNLQVGAGQMQAAEFEAIERQANMLAASSIVPSAFRNKPGDIVAVASIGREVGLSVMASMQSIHIIEGKPTMSAQLIGSLIRARGHSLAITKMDDDGVEMVGTRADTGDSMRFSFSRNDARVAGLLGKKVWQQHFRPMASARCITQIGRTLFGDVLAGISYSVEEGASIANVEVAVDPEGEVVAIAGEVVANRVVPTADAEPAEEIVDAETFARIIGYVQQLTAEQQPTFRAYAQEQGITGWKPDTMTVAMAEAAEAKLTEMLGITDELAEEGELEEPVEDAGIAALTEELQAEPVERIASNGAVIPPNPARSSSSRRRTTPTASRAAS